MPAFVIPTDSGPDAGPQVIRTTLSGTVYQLTIRHNARAGMWRLDIADAAGAAIASGLPLRNAGLPANAAVYGRAGFPSGLLLALASADLGADAGLAEFGARVLLMYQGAA